MCDTGTDGEKSKRKYRSIEGDKANGQIQWSRRLTSAEDNQQASAGGGRGRGYEGERGRRPVREDVMRMKTHSNGHHHGSPQNIQHSKRGETESDVFWEILFFFPVFL